MRALNALMRPLGESFLRLPLEAPQSLLSIGFFVSKVRLSKDGGRPLSSFSPWHQVCKEVEVMNKKPIVCSSSSKAFSLLKPHISHSIEEFWVISLGPSNYVLSIKKLFKGTVDSCLFHPRDLFRATLFANASRFIVAHNHPSSCLMPSDEDLNITQKIKQGAYILGIHFVDHLIVSTEQYLSLAHAANLQLDKRL